MLLPKSGIRKKLLRQPLTLTAANFSSIVEMDQTVEISYYNLLIDLCGQQLIDTTTNLTPNGFTAPAQVHTLAARTRMKGIRSCIIECRMMLLLEFDEMTLAEGSEVDLLVLQPNTNDLPYSLPALSETRRASSTACHG